MGGIVYCLTNRAMPNYIKIGMRAVLEDRLRQLDNTSRAPPLRMRVRYGS